MKEALFKEIRNAERLALMAALLLAGCATATLTVARQENAPLPRPDRVLVHDFTVTPDDIQLDRGLGPMAARFINGTDPSKEVIYLGEAFAKVLATNLAVELRMRGIKTYPGSAYTTPEETTLSIKGRFLRIDEGNGTLRTLVGFGLGGTEMRTRVQLLHGIDGNTQLLAEAESTTKSNLKPGIAAMIGIGGGAGSLLAGATVAGITTIPSERFFATAEADAKRTAEKLADWVAEYYRRQGWIRP